MLPDSGVTAGGESPVDDVADAVPSSAPEPFRSAASSLLETVVRPEARVERIRPPQRLAPWNFVVAIDVTTPVGYGASGRLVVLCDMYVGVVCDVELRLVG